MWIIATVSGILGFFVLLILLLAIPVDLIFYVESSDGFRSRARVRWLFGLIGKDIGGGKDKKDKDKEGKKKRRIISFFSRMKKRIFPKRKKKKEKKYKAKIKSFFTIIKNRGILRKLAIFIRQAFRILKIRNLEVRLRIGLDDPADTGMLFAFVAPTMLYFKSFRSCDIYIEPDFVKEDIRGHLKGDLRIVPIKIVKPLFLFLFSLTTLRVIKAIIGAR